MHFQGPAKRWLSLVEEELENQGWDEFCAQLLSRFARDEHELLHRLFQIRQTGPVSKYIEKFVGPVDELKAYAKNPDPLYYVQHFIDGLRDEIKAVLMVHKPATLDTACMLAELQEEALGLTKRPYRRFDQASNSKPGWGPPLALPPPPPQAPGAVRRPVNVAATTIDDKMQALRAARRAQGLCYRCGAKWSRDHRCSETVQLHLVQELWDILPISDDADEEGPASPTTSYIMMHLSVSAMVGSTAPGTLCLSGSIQGIAISILVDSGSSHSFLNASLAQSLVGVQNLAQPISVQVANGDVTQCSAHIPAAHWEVQDYSFSIDLKLFPLSAYDMILGLDWLGSFSPMHVHWSHQWMAIPYQGSTAVLLGKSASVPSGSVIQLCLVQDSAEPHLATAHLPVAVQDLLSEFAQLFEPVSGLPPRRDCDHAIPLIPGAHPVAVRPYRYAPMLKSEIERQVTDMLQQGIIQKSSSSFASPVLLVMKKDQTWHFCVDYRQLNAITAKAKYPVPVIEELLDELAGASVFSTLDLQSGFH